MSMCLPYHKDWFCSPLLLEKAGKKPRGNMPAWDIGNTNEFDKLQLLLSHWFGPRAENPSQDLYVWLDVLLQMCQQKKKKKNKKEEILAFPVIWSYKMWFTFSQLLSADTLTHGCICNLLSVYSDRFITLQTFSQDDWWTAPEKAAKQQSRR